MAGAAVSLIGTAASLYSGSKASSAAADQMVVAKRQYKKNQAIGEELKTRWNSLVEPNLVSLLEQSSSNELSPASRLAADQYLRGIGKIRQNVLEDSGEYGPGLTSSKLLTLDINQAKDLAGITLNDQTQKKSDLLALMSFAGQTPNWAAVQTNSNNTMGAFATNLAGQYTQAANSAYGAAAQGLYQLGQSFADRSTASTGLGNSFMTNGSTLNGSIMNPNANTTILS